jgi:hypothetical protein
MFRKAGRSGNHRVPSGQGCEQAHSLLQRLLLLTLAMQYPEQGEEPFHRGVREELQPGLGIKDQPVKAGRKSRIFLLERQG